jgi:hypothetical protein
MILLIDDLKDLKADRIARTFLEGIQALQEGPWDLLLLDHDLGDPNPKHTGYDILSWLEQRPEFLPGKIELVTWNAPGREKMKLVLRKLYGDL